MEVVQPLEGRNTTAKSLLSVADPNDEIWLNDKEIWGENWFTYATWQAAQKSANT